LNRAIESIMQRRVLVAVAQMTSTTSIRKNYEVVQDLVKRASNVGCKLVAFPECFSFLGDAEIKSPQIAEPLDGDILGKYKELARQHQIWLSLGGFQQSSPDPEKVYNTHVILNNEGKLVDHYQKIHLFDVDIPNGPKLLESGYTVPGDRIVTVDSPAGVLGVTTCYDVRFPGLYSNLRRRGAEVLLIPAAFTVKTGFAHWETLLRARAIENQCFVLAAAQIGKHNSKRETYGYSMIIDPWGTVLAQTSPKETKPCLAFAELDFNSLENIRMSMPIGNHEKTDLYRSKL